MLRPTGETPWGCICLPQVNRTTSHCTVDLASFKLDRLADNWIIWRHLSTYVKVNSPAYGITSDSQTLRFALVMGHSG